CFSCMLFFFFQAEDGIRDATVTGVQTCALPISRSVLGFPDREREGVMEVLLLSELEIRELIGPAEALPAVRDAFVRLARGEAILPGVIHLDVPNSGAEVHVKGAHLRDSPFLTVKVASGSYATPERGLPVGSGIVLVFDSTTGFPR